MSNRVFSVGRLCAAVGVLGTASVALADDLFPPSWRGGPLSVRAEWEFLQPPANLLEILPDAFEAVGGAGGEFLYPTFQTHAEVDLVSNWAWTIGDGNGGLTPLNPAGAELAFKVQNWVDLQPEKWLRIQVTFQSPQGLAPHVGGLTGVEDPITQYPGLPVGPEISPFPGFMYQDWMIRPNPDWDLIWLTVPFGATIDQVVIDTISIPAPAGTAVIGLMGLACLRRRR